MERCLTYMLLTLAAICGLAQHASAQIVDAEGQYVDTIFHDHVNRQAEDFIAASLVVCEPSNVLYSTLGHACLHMQCPAYGMDFYFSYESENVREKVWTFLKGDLKMGMAAWEPEEFRQMYADSGRGIKEYTLHLSPQQKQALWYYLDQRVDEGLNLPYDYFHRGCAKSVVDVVKSALGPNVIRYGAWPERLVDKTQRELVADYIKNDPWNEFVLYFLVGVEGDADCSPEQKLIIPTDLVEVWQQATIDGHPLLDSEPRVLVDGEPKAKSTWCTPLLVAILLLLISWWTPYPMLVAQTAIGVVMAYLILFSDLPCTNWNWLLIPFNPLPAIAWHWRKYWALPWAMVLTVWLIAMVVYPHMLIDWSHAILVLAMIVLFAKQWWLGRK